MNIKQNLIPDLIQVPSNLTSTRALYGGYVVQYSHKRGVSEIKAV